MTRNTPPVRTYRIYALYDPCQRLAFLGKSYTKDLAPMYSKHLCGKNIYTKEHFGKTLPQIVPQLAILESVTGTYRDGYRHLVAWTRFFLDAGYTMIMQESTIFYAESLHFSTKAIYDAISTEPLDTVLLRGHCTPSQSIKQNSSNTKPKKEGVDTSVQFNLRVFESDMLDFLELCKTRGLTRKEGFSLLLRNAFHEDMPLDSYAEEEINTLKERLASQTAALETAENKLCKLSASLCNDKRYQNLLDTVQGLLQEYCELLNLGSDAQPFQKLKICSYHSYPYFSKFDYPKVEQDMQIIKLKGLVYGKGRTPAIFILAETKDGQLVKFRSYPKKGYVGISIPRSAWTYLGAKWLVTWHRVSDGAIELTASLPLALSLDTLTLDDYQRAQKQPGQHASLDEVICRANEKNHHQ